MLTYLMVFFAVLLTVAGVIAWRLRKRRQSVGYSPDEEKTLEQLDCAFGRNMKWGRPGGTESELHDRAAADHSEADAPDADD